MSRRPSRRQRGQVLPLAALLLFGFVGVAAFAVDAGMNYVDRRTLQAASDQAALAGASELSVSNNAALVAAQYYAWQNLRVTPSSFTCGTSGTCMVTSGTFPQTGSYQISATIGFTTPVSGIAHNPQYSSTQVVTVDIVHINPRSGFEGALGMSSVTVRSHSAAIAHEGVHKFPFAIATRYLDLQGSGTATAFGAVLLGECDDSGVGDFTDHNSNGGVYLNGGATLVLGSAGTPLGGGAYEYSSAQGIVLADPSTRGNCTSSNSNTNADAGWTQMKDSVGFTAATSQEFNYYYGFTSGPYGVCTNSDSVQLTCTASATGDGNWEDPPCWRQSNNAIVPINSTSQVYTGGSVPNGVGSGTACTSGAANSYEGSFVDSAFPSFPIYADPIAVLSTLLQTGVPTVAPAGLNTTLAASGSYSDTGQYYFTSYQAGTGASLTFSPGYYVFDGSAATVALKNGSSFTCTAPQSSDKVKGCVFIFRNGAGLDIQSNSAAVNCSATAGTGSQYGNCSFELSDSGTTTSYLSFSSSVAVAAHPIAYTLSDGTATHFPLIYSNGSTNCFASSKLNCAVSLSQPGNFDIGGTIYVPHGILNMNANGASASGQIVADTVKLQTGASAVVTGVAYKGDEVAPVLGPSTLIE